MNFIKIKLLVIAVIMFAASSAFASLSYDVTVDTSSLSGSTGYLYLQFNPLSGNTSDATAVVSNFATNGTLGVQDTTNIGFGGNVSGTLPGTVTFDNGYGTGFTKSGINDYNQAITFGTSFSFSVLLTQALNNPATDGSSFTLSLFQDAIGLSPLKTANGTLVTLNLNSDGTATPTITDAGTTATPIPAAAWLLGSGLMGLAGIRRRMNA